MENVSTICQRLGDSEWIMKGIENSLNSKQARKDIRAIIKRYLDKEKSDSYVGDSKSIFYSNFIFKSQFSQNSIFTKNFQEPFDYKL